MDNYTNKIYARLNESGIVIRLFSSVFEQALKTDILVEEGNEEYHAHVHLKYELMDTNGRYNYKVVKGKLVELKDTEKDELFPVQEPQPTELELLKQQLLQTQAVLAQMQYNSLINGEGYNNV